MVARTRNMAADEMQRRNTVIERITGYGERTSLRLAIENAGYNGLADLIGAMYEDYDSMAYRYDTNWDADGTDETAQPAWEERTLNKAESGILKCFKAYVQSRIDEDTELNQAFWDGLTRDEFDKFRIGQECTGMIMGGSSSPTAGAIRPNDDIAMWMKSIKRDPLLYPELKADSGWSTWDRAVTAIAYSQGVENVLNGNYRPRQTTGPHLYPPCPILLSVMLANGQRLPFRNPLYRLS